MFKGMFDRLEKMWGGGEQGAKRVNTFRWLILIGCLGAALMILSSFFSVEREVPGDSSSAATSCKEETNRWLMTAMTRAETDGGTSEETARIAVSSSARATRSRLGSETTKPSADAARTSE